MAQRNRRRMKPSPLHPISAKRLNSTMPLSELAPQAGVIAMLVNTNNPQSERMIREVQEAARGKGLRLPILKAGTEDEFESAFGCPRPTACRRAGRRRRRILCQPARRARGAGGTPCSSGDLRWPFAAAGGLISYGRTLAGIDRLAGAYVGRILAGAKPADLPVQQPTRFELVVNLNTAKALGLTVPPSILARADEVVE
jgi:putative tryptophan/tyrosine transport system substrate-binding protein